MRRAPSSVLLLLLLLWTANATAADDASKPDSEQPITIEADRAEIDERQQVSIYTGNVILVQGSVTVHADTVTVHTRDGELYEVFASGDPVRYHQDKVDKEDLNGHSLRLHYNADSRLLILTQKAELWQGNNRFSGERIQYNLDQEKVIATGGEEGPSQKGRVSVTIQPKSSEDKTKP